jgi:hypothetical protein
LAGGGRPRRTIAGWPVRRSTAVPDTPHWLHEVKHDGYRLRLERDGDHVRLNHPWRLQLDRPLSVDRRGGLKNRHAQARDSLQGYHINAGLCCFRLSPSLAWRRYEPHRGRLFESPKPIHILVDRCRYCTLQHIRFSNLKWTELQTAMLIVQGHSVAGCKRKRGCLLRSAAPRRQLVLPDSPSGRSRVTRHRCTYSRHNIVFTTRSFCVTSPIFGFARVGASLYSDPNNRH